MSLAIFTCNRTLNLLLYKTSNLPIIFNDSMLSYGLKKFARNASKLFYRNYFYDWNEARCQKQPITCLENWRWKSLFPNNQWNAWKTKKVIRPVNLRNRKRFLSFENFTCNSTFTFTLALILSIHSCIDPLHWLFAFT